MIMLYALGLNKTISKGYGPRNGSDIILNILNTNHTSTHLTNIVFLLIQKTINDKH